MIHLKKPISIISLVAFIIILVLTGFYMGRLSLTYCSSFIPSTSKKGTSPIFDKDKVSVGFTLFTTIGNTKQKSVGDQKVYLIDMYGNQVHTWKTEYQPFYSQLKNNGNLLVSQISPLSKNFKWLTTPLIQELDWEGKVVWQYENGLMHHDFESLPNNNLAFLIYQKVPDQIAKNVQGGIDNPLDNDEVYSDAIVEIDQKGETVWQWDLYKHLDYSKDILGDSDMHGDWTHTNSIRYLEKNPINGEEAYLISIRNLSFVAIISKKSGEIIWRSPAGMLDHQHDATLIENGNILVFDNGFDIHPKIDGIMASRAVEIDPKTQKVVWEFKGNEVLSQSHFYNSILGGAQKLKNGNVLITLGTNGELLEVTSDNKIVWDYINPYLLKTEAGGFPINYIFKSRRIYKEDLEPKIKQELKDALYEVPFICK
jgi:hypothetical protein